jgi:o-succinylbenzoate synthase
VSLPSLDDLLATASVVVVPLTTRFRGVTERVAVLVEGPVGWAEFAPFPEYDAAHAARWLAAAVEAAWQGWPQAVRGEVPVNAIVPAVPADLASRAVAESGGCRTAKVKVADHDGSLDDDVARVAAVRAALEAGGPGGRVRVDANGRWTLAEARVALAELDAVAGGLEYAEQPVESLEDMAALRRAVDVPLAVDEGVRWAADPTRVAGVREAADVVVLKVPPLAGVHGAIAVADAYDRPVVVSSALDTSVGLAAGVALAAALDELPYACGLGTGRLLAADVVPDEQRLLPRAGTLPVRPYAPVPDPRLLADLVAPPEVDREWRSRLAAAYGIMAGR